MERVVEGGRQLEAGEGARRDKVAKWEGGIWVDQQLQRFEEGWRRMNKSCQRADASSTLDSIVGKEGLDSCGQSSF